MLPARFTPEPAPTSAAAASEPGIQQQDIFSTQPAGNVGVQSVQFAPLTQAGIGLEIMDTAAACRTYNILMSEDRNVVAALFMIEE